MINNNISQEELTNILSQASIDYYNGKTSKLSDEEFDVLFKQLQKLEKSTGIVYPNSPTQRVGSDIQDKFKKGEHPKPMFTIENTYDDNGLSEWVLSMYEKYKIEKYNISIKYDGVSCELWYEDGILVKALTRGDKLIGDDITENVRTIKNIPLVLYSKLYKKETIYIRGEILMPKSTLNKINNDRIKKGLDIFANTRNACSGSVKQLDPKVTASRGLIFKAWDVFKIDNDNFHTMEEKINFLESIGFYYEKGTKPFTVDINEIVEGNIMNKVSKFKDTIDLLNLDFDYDGIVIKVDDIKVQDKIGTKDTRAIEWGIARKWNEDREVRTELLDVEWQVGRTGILTPVGRLKPVICDGVEISNVTLHNWDFIKEKNIKILSNLRITRSGGVIPYVIDAINTGKEKEIIYPYYCPICGSKVVSHTDVLISCSNENCPAIVEGKIIHFCSKECMDIRGVGESVVKDLIKSNLITCIEDLYKLKRYTPEELSNILGEGYGVKSCQNIIKSIEDSKKKTFANVLAGLSIPNVGKVMARLLANTFKNIKNFLNAKLEELLGLEGIGEILANEIYKWINTPNNINMCRNLEQEGLIMEVIEEVKLNNNGLKVCFTGTSNRFTGDNIEKFLEENGFKCSGISKKLDYLIIGEKPGPSKVKKAEEYGVTIISENNFYEKYNL